MRKLFLTIVGITLPGITYAHVGYVLDEETFEEAKGADYAFLFEALGDTTNIILIGATIAVVGLLYYISHRIGFILHELEHITKTVRSYFDYIPWIIRLAIGIALIGAGTEGVLISPILESFPSFSSIQILLGFMLLGGILAAPAMLAVIGLYLYALIQTPYMLGSLDLFVMAVAFLIIADERPGLDHIIGLPAFRVPLREKLLCAVPLLLRLGIGSAMLFLAFYEKILNPHTSRLVILDYNLHNIIPVSESMWVFSVGIIEAAIALLLIAGLQTRLTSAIAVIVLSFSFFFFNEAVYSHVTLFGILSILFITGGGMMSLDNLIHKKEHPLHYPDTCQTNR